MTSRKLRLVATACGLLALGTTACAPPNAQSAANAAVPQAPAVQSQAAAAAAPEPTADERTLTETQFGPLSPVDRKLLSLVQQTSIREITTSIWAQERSANPAVREAARVIITQHKDLEAKDGDISTRMSLPVPDQPSPDMQQGITRMQAETGETFDRDWVNTLRQAHAQALILVSTVRADTRNSLVRPFAGLAGDYIKTHIDLLEKTGDVDYAQLPVPAL
jgi:predicted outer membrane protein